MPQTGNLRTKASKNMPITFIAAANICHEQPGVSTQLRRRRPKANWMAKWDSTPNQVRQRVFCNCKVRLRTSSKVLRQPNKVWTSKKNSKSIDNVKCAAICRTSFLFSAEKKETILPQTLLVEGRLKALLRQVSGKQIYTQMEAICVPIAQYELSKPSWSTEAGWLRQSAFLPQIMLLNVFRWLSTMFLPVLKFRFLSNCTVFKARIHPLAFIKYRICGANVENSIFFH